MEVKKKVWDLLKVTLKREIKNPAARYTWLHAVMVVRHWGQEDARKFKVRTVVAGNRILTMLGGIADDEDRAASHCASK